jgi:propanediol utilization protein
MSMNEQAITKVMEEVIKGVVGQLKTEATHVSVSKGTGEPIPVELSARHVHLSEQDALELFGKPLTPVRELSQPGQFLCEERVRLIGPKGVMDNVAVLGPARSASQVEISNTEARTLGVKAPVRQSGDVAGTPGIILASQTGIVGLEEGVIVAARHIHMSPEDGEKYGVKDNDRVSVRLESERPVILEDVIVRISPSFKLAMHIDPDEGNSAGWNKSVKGKIVR